ncbi:MAG TPA: hypothetical protein VFH43_14630 [Candidatus Kapabacteria bacterium]|nr:hypothetical protein [Candidatus Kapabacteria bacterium]
MQRIASVFSLAALLLWMGCVAESDVQQLAPQRIGDHFQRSEKLDAGELFRDSLYPLHPNPFNSDAGDTSVVIEFTVGDTTRTIVLIQNAVGEEVVRFEDETLSPGQYRAPWQPLSSEREPLRAGLYFVTFRTEHFVHSRTLSIQVN